MQSTNKRLFFISILIMGLCVFCWVYKEKMPSQDTNHQTKVYDFNFKKSDVLYVQNPDLILTVNLNLFQDDEYFWTVYRLNPSYLHDAIIELSDKKPIDYYYQEVDFDLSHQYNILDKNQQLVWQHTNITDRNGFCKKNCSHPNVTIFKTLSPTLFKIDDDFIHRTSKNVHLNKEDCQVTRIDDKKIKLFDKMFYFSIMGGLNWYDYGKVWCNDDYTLFFKDSDKSSSRTHGILFDNQKKIPIMFFNSDYWAMQPSNFGHYSISNTGNMQAKFAWYVEKSKYEWQILPFYDKNIKNIQSAIVITSDDGNHLLVQAN